MEKVLCDDILKIIITFLDDNSCVVFARTCKHLHDLVHDSRKTIVVTDNVFEAVRIGSIASFKAAHINEREMPAIIEMNNITIPMLEYIYDITWDCDTCDKVAYKLCKRGVFVPFQSEQDKQSRYHRSLVVHAVNTHCDELLTHMKSILSVRDLLQYSACGYAKGADYNGFMRCHSDPQYIQDERLIYYTCVGRNKDIMRVLGINECASTEAIFAHQGVEAYDVGYAPLSNRCVKHLIKCGDSTLFGNINRGPVCEYIISICIKYNALDIIRKWCLINFICDEGISPYMVNTTDMTMEMALLLLELTDNHHNVITLIIVACNYRLTEMLRARGLYNKVHTREDNHTNYYV